jgi:putative Mg2+ transporter-C (MgtC) family protein
MMAIGEEALVVTVSTGEILTRLLIALACGGAIGLNRDLHRKSAGFRTFGLVSVGAAIVALIIIQASADPNAVSRVIQGVLTGIGFLCAGVIIHQPTSNRVGGLTTAAAVWLTAGLGLACGLGQFALALSGLAIALLILFVGRPIEIYLEKIFSKRHGKTHEAQETRDGDA